MMSGRKINQGFFEKSRDPPGNGLVVNQGHSNVSQLAAGLEVRIKQARCSGCLNLQAQGLGAIRKSLFEYFYSNSSRDGLMDDVDFKWWEVVDLKEVKLGHNAIKILEPGCFNRLPIEFLSMENNKLDIFPNECIDELAETLKRLIIAHNEISMIELKVCFDQLLLLDLSHNRLDKITGLDISFAIPNVLTLNLSNNQLRSFHGNILPRKLVHLDMSDNLLEDIPATLFKHSFELEELNLSKNSLTKFPEDLSALINLKIMDMRNNEISLLPGFKLQLPTSNKMDQLLLGFNKLENIDALLPLISSGTRRFSTTFASLTVLDLQDNNLQDFPMGICALDNLRMLELSNNDLSTLPSLIGYMNNLHVIRIEGNLLRSFRREVLVGGCSKLKDFLRSRDTAGIEKKAIILTQALEEQNQKKVKQVEPKIILKERHGLEAAVQGQNCKSPTATDERNFTLGIENSETQTIDDIVNEPVDVVSSDKENVKKEIMLLEKELDEAIGMNKYKMQDMKMRLIKLRAGLINC